MTLRKRFRYAWNVFWTNPELIEFSFDALDELGEPVPEEEDDEMRLKRQYERLYKIEEYRDNLKGDIGIETEN